MKITSIVSIITILGWVLLTLFQLWGSGIGSELYVKITISIVLVNIGIGVSALILREYKNENKMRKDKFLD